MEKGPHTAGQQAMEDSRNAFPSLVRLCSVRIRKVLVALTGGGSISGAHNAGAREWATGLDKTLVWRVVRISTGSDAVASLMLMPGPAAQRMLLSAFRRAGAPNSLIEQAASAFDEFESLIQLHAGDRKTFDIMLSSLTETDLDEREESIRKSAFISNSAAWGIQVKVRVVSWIVTPAVSQDECAFASIGGFVDCRRLRSNLPWTITSPILVDSAERLLHKHPVRPLDPSQTGFDTAPILRQFCSRVLPPVRRVMRGDTIAEFQIDGETIGNSGVFTCHTGMRRDGGVPRWKGEETTGDYAAVIRIPTEMLHLDVLVHRGLYKQFQLTPHVHCLLPGTSVSGNPTSTYPEVKVSGLQVTRLADSFDDLETHDIPEYGPMIDQSVRWMGFDLSDFFGVRLRMNYPLLSTMVSLRHELPDRPEAV